MNMEKPCLFCEGKYLGEQHPELVVFEDERFYVIHSLEEETPTYLGELLTVTKRHLPSFASLTGEEAAALGGLLTRVSAATQAVTGASHSYTYFFGEGNKHLHIYTIARYDAMPAEYVRLATDAWPDAPRGSAACVAKLCARLRAHLANGAASAPDVSSRD
ncbi:MAG TPA: hypothetical protein VF807_01165 [Ktedonobacterales bacterium]